MFEIHKELKNLNTKRTNNPVFFKRGGGYRTRQRSPKKKCKWLRNMFKVAPTLIPRYNLELLWDFIFALSERLRLRKQKIPNAGKNVGKRTLQALLVIVNWYGHSGNPCTGSSRKWKIGWPYESDGQSRAHVPRTRFFCCGDYTLTVFTELLRHDSPNSHQLVRDNGNMASTYNGILVSCKEKWAHEICRYKDGAGKGCTE